MPSFSLIGKFKSEEEEAEELKGMEEALNKTLKMLEAVKHADAKAIKKKTKGKGKKFNKGEKPITFFERMNQEKKKKQESSLTLYSAGDFMKPDVKRSDFGVNRTTYQAMRRNGGMLNSIGANMEFLDVDIGADNLDALLNQCPIVSTYEEKIQLFRALAMKDKNVRETDREKRRKSGGDEKLTSDMLAKFKFDPTKDISLQKMKITYYEIAEIFPGFNSDRMENRLAAIHNKYADKKIQTVYRTGKTVIKMSEEEVEKITIGLMNVKSGSESAADQEVALQMRIMMKILKTMGNKKLTNDYLERFTFSVNEKLEAMLSEQVVEADYKVAQVFNKPGALMVSPDKILSLIERTKNAYYTPLWEVFLYCGYPKYKLGAHYQHLVTRMSSEIESHPDSKLSSSDFLKECIANWDSIRAKPEEGYCTRYLQRVAKDLRNLSRGRLAKNFM